MKADELMVGDYLRVNRDRLCIPEGKIVRVTEIDSENTFREKGLKGCARCEAVGDPWLSGGIWCDYLDPIPLTPEILEKNGFSKSRLMGEQRHFTYYLAPSVSLLAIYDADFSLKIGDCARYIKYVHQLQHALRLCGIEKEITL